MTWKKCFKNRLFVVRFLLLIRTSRKSRSNRTDRQSGCRYPGAGVCGSAGEGQLTPLSSRKNKKAQIPHFLKQGRTLEKVNSLLYKMSINTEFREQMESEDFTDT